MKRTEHIRQMQQHQLNRELAEGYAANADLSRELAEELAFVDSELG